MTAMLGSLVVPLLPDGKPAPKPVELVDRVWLKDWSICFTQPIYPVYEPGLPDSAAIDSADHTFPSTPDTILRSGEKRYRVGRAHAKVKLGGVVIAEEHGATTETYNAFTSFWAQTLLGKFDPNSPETRGFMAWCRDHWTHGCDRSPLKPYLGDDPVADALNTYLDWKGLLAFPQIHTANG
jgi:hypothetical protein